MCFLLKSELERLMIFSLILSMSVFSLAVCPLQPRQLLSSFSSHQKNSVHEQNVVEDLETKLQREKIREMMQHAWKNYAQYAWGQNELKPISKRGQGGVFGSNAFGTSIVDALDTLYIMGMHEEFKQGRDWIAENLTINSLNTDVPVFETNIRFVGGLLACFALTGDALFRDKAAEIAEKLLPAFKTKTGIPLAVVNLESGFGKNYGWASGGCSILAEFGGLHLEFSYLSEITCNPVFQEKVDHIRHVMQRISKPNGLYPNYFNPRRGEWGQYHMSIGGQGDSFYEYLLKAWLQSGQEDQEARQMFVDAMFHIIEHMLRVSPGGLMYISDMKFDRLENKMDHLGCFSGGLFGLAAHTLKSNMTKMFMKIAEGITNTCHESYERTAVKLGPEVFYFVDSSEARALRNIEKNYFLRPEVIESYFIMWRLTKDPKYRKWGWEAVEALEKHCRVSGGYSGVRKVYSDFPANDDTQQTFFLGATLKYLYLLFSDDSLISLNEWVFNTAGHPLPIKNVHI